MTTSDWKKAFKQLKNKPAKLKKYTKHNKPKERSCGKARFRCRICGTYEAYIKTYGIGLCRKCFRENALKLGFKKYS